VSVVVPCYNYGHYLEACVGSVLSQAAVDVDVLIIDDASPDGSGVVARRIASREPRVAAVVHTANRGHIATYNEGLATARGEYIVLLSADDLLPPGSLERATALLAHNPSVGMVYGRAARFEDEVPESGEGGVSWTVWQGSDWISERFRAGTNTICSPEVVLRSSVQREIGRYRKELPHTGDLEMWLRAAAVANVGYVGGMDQGWYRVHDSNMHTSRFLNGSEEGMVADMTLRLEAFESASTDLSRADLATDMLMIDARRAISREALTLALRGYYWGIVDTWPVDELQSFALEIHPAASRSLQWRLLQLLRGRGRKQARWNPFSLGHEAALRVKGVAKQWRMERSGV
jgi:glycosyltransferase involved in cell wall biosynthesis